MPESTLYWACRQGNKALATSVIAHHNHSTAKYIHPDIGDTPLHQACKHGWLDIAKLLIEKHGVNPEVTDNHYQSPLHYACQHGHKDIVKYLIVERHCNPFLRSSKQLEPLDYALNCGRTDIAAYICRSSVSSSMMLMQERSETTVNLVKKIVLPPCYRPGFWKTSDGEFILHVACTSELYTSCIPSPVMQMLLEPTEGVTLEKMRPDWKTADGDTIFRLVCQSRSCMLRLSSRTLLSWLNDRNVTTSMLLCKPGIPNWKTADGDTIRDLVWQSASCISKIPSKVISKMLSKFVPSSTNVHWKTADGIVLLQLVCQSKLYVSQIASRTMLEWFKETPVELSKFITPDWKTADGDTLFQLICQSETHLSQIPSGVMLQWFHLVQNIIETINMPDMKTADGDSLLQLICQSKYISYISSAVLLNWLTKTTLDIVTAISPNSKTADGDSILYLICQSEKCLLKVPSTILLKWLSETTLDIIARNVKTADGNTIIEAVCQFEILSSIPSKPVLKEFVNIPVDLIITSNCRTDDDDTRLQLICVSQLCISHIRSSSFLNFLTNTSLDLGRIIVPNWKTADSDTILQLVCKSEGCLSRIYSDMLLKWLSDSTVNLVQIIKASVETTSILIQIVFNSKLCISRIPSNLMLEWLMDETFSLLIQKLNVSDWKTADGDTLLHLICQSKVSLSHVPSAVLLQWFNHASLTQNLQNIDIVPDIKTADGQPLIQLVCLSELFISHIMSAKILECFINTTLDIEKLIAPSWKTADGTTLLQVVCQSEKCLSSISSSVIQQWLSNTTDNLELIIVPYARTANGDTLFQLVCRSKKLLSQISSPVLLKWLSDTNVGSVSKIFPNCKTASGDTLLQLICQSIAHIERVSSSMLLNWLHDTTFDLIIPNVRTADHDTIIQIVCHPESIISCVPSMSILKELIDTPVNLIITPNWSTDNGLHLLCVSKVCISHVSSSTLFKWLNSTTLDLGRIVESDGRTADGDTLLQLTCQSKACIARMPSMLLLNGISNTTIDPMKILEPNWVTNDGDTLLQLLSQSETCISMVSSAVLLTWLQNTTQDLLLHNWKTADNNTIIDSLCQIESNKVLCITSNKILKEFSDMPVDIVITPYCKTGTVYIICLAELCISHIPSSTLIQWMNNTTLDLGEIIVSNWKTADGDTLCELVCHSETSLSRISSTQVLKWLNDAIIDPEVINCNLKTGDDDIFLQLALQSEPFLSKVSSSLMLIWLSKTSFHLSKVIVPHWKTADGNTLVELICGSEQCIGRISSSVLLKWTGETSYDYVWKRMVPTWKTADGDILVNLLYESDITALRMPPMLLLNWLSFTTFDVVKTIKPNQKTADALLQHICQSEVHLSHIPSAILFNWLDDTNLDVASFVIPELRTAEGDTVLQLICKSKSCVSRIPSAIMLQWLHSTSHDLLMHNWKTADGDTIIRILCQFDSNTFCIPSKMIVNEFTDTTVDLFITPNHRTDSRDTSLQLSCISGLCMSYIPSSTLLKWLSKTTINLEKIIVPNWKTADGDTLLQLILQHRSWILQLSSKLLLKWLSYGDHNDFKSIMPEAKTADGDTLFQLVCQSKKCLMQVSSSLLLKWLGKVTFDIGMHIIHNPNQKTADGDTNFQLVCMSAVVLNQLPSVVLLKWLNDSSLDSVSKILPNCKTANGDTLLQLICRSKPYIRRVSSSLLLNWLHDTTFDLIIPNVRTADGDTIIQVICKPDSKISCIPVLKEFTNTPHNLIITPNWSTDSGLHLLCVSQQYLPHLPSSSLMNWLNNTTLNLNSIIDLNCNCKTANGDTLLQLICQSKVYLQHISYSVLLTWLCGTTVDLIIPNIMTANRDTIIQVISKPESKIDCTLLTPALLRNLKYAPIDLIVTLNWKRDDNDSRLHLLCVSELCVSYISSSTLLNWFHKTTLDLERIIVSNWKTADGDTLFQLVLQSEICISKISSALLLKWFDDTTPDLVSLIVPEWKTADGDTLFQVVCLSGTFLQQISSVILLIWLNDTSLDLLSRITPNCKTASGDILLQLICQSKAYIKRMPPALLLNWLHDTTFDLIIPNVETADGDTVIQIVCKPDSKISCIPSASLLKGLTDSPVDLIITPNWKRDDNGDNRLHLLCASEMCISYIPSTLMSKWLNSTTLLTNLERLFEPTWKTADGIILLQMFCQSKKFISKTSSALLLKWFGDTKLDLIKFTMPERKTADGDTLFQLVICQCKTYISHLPSALLLKWISDSNLDIKKSIEFNIIATADCDALLLLVCQSESYLSHMSSSMLLQWLNETILDIVDIIVPNWKTADGDTLLQLVCQSEVCLSHTPSSVLLEWLTNNITDCTLARANVGTSKTADGDTLFQLIIHRFETIIPRLSSNTVKKWLNEKDAKIAELMTTINPNQKTANDDAILHLLCQSDMKEKEIVELLQLYLQKNILNPDITNSDGDTALHLACQTNKSAVVTFLFKETHCDINIINKANFFPLDKTTNPEIILILCQSGHISIHSKTIKRWLNNTAAIDDTTMISIFKLFVHNQKLKTIDGSTLLHITCQNLYDIFRDRVRLIDYLLKEAHCDPNGLDSNEYMPLQLTFDSRIMKKLIDHGAKVTSDVVFRLISDKDIPDHLANELLILSTRKMTILWKPDDLNSDGDTALQAACKAGRASIVNFLLIEAHCDPNTRDNVQKELPLELTSDIKTINVLVRHGARMTPELVLKFESIESIPRDALIQFLSESWNPDDKNTDGNTALHLACIADRPTTVNFLLSKAYCNPNTKNSVTDELPLEMTTNPEIIRDLIKYGAQTSMMYQSCKEALRTNKPITPPVKVFVVGNPSVGKSTLTAALKKRLKFMARIFTSGKVSGVDQKTVGIVPHEMEDDIFGRITIYDFAGHKEFYSGHAALLQTAIQSTPPIFLIVVNLCDEKDETIHNILYWISFLENQCILVTQKPHVIIVGSHADTLKSKGVSSQEKAVAIINSIADVESFRNLQFIDVITMDCQYHESTGMNDLRRCLVRSCNELRIQEPIPFNAHCFLVYLIETFIDSPAMTVNAICEQMDKSRQSSQSAKILNFLPEDMGALYKICIELNERGHILFLKNKVAAELSYVVIDKESLLSEVSGTVFAPEGFKEYKQLSTNTGVVSLSKIAECFPGKDLKILIGFLNHLEFCHEISDQALCKLISELYVKVPDERHYLFPALISLKAEDTIWETETQYDHMFGWILQCTNREQFFSSRFLQVLLLRLAFSFALSIEIPSTNQSLGIHRKCSLWKNGIFWGREFGMETLVEVLNDKSVIVMARFQASNIGKCIKHRSNVLQTILECAEEFCPRISRKESFIDASSSVLQYPFVLIPEKALCTVHDIADALISDCREPSVVSSATGNSVPASKFLSFEPYTEIDRSILHKLWDNGEEVMSNAFLSRLIQQVSGKVSWFAELFSEVEYFPSSGDDLMQKLSKWKDNQIANCKTFKDLRLKLDEYSVLSGRDLLKKAATKVDTPTDNPEKESSDTLQLQDNHLLSVDDLAFVQETVWEGRAKWYNIGLGLGLTAGTLDAIEETNRHDTDQCFRETLKKWLSKSELKPSWSGLAAALRAPTVGREELAQNLPEI